VLQIRAGRKLCKRVVLGLLLQGLALFEPILDVGNHVADAGVGVIAREQVVDLGDYVFERGQFRIAGRAGARLLGRLQRNTTCEFAGSRALLMLGDDCCLHGQAGSMPGHTRTTNSQVSVGRVCQYHCHSSVATARCR
jgi:hypothetical protein